MWVHLTCLSHHHYGADIFFSLGQKRVYARHWVARIVCLIGLPIMVYMLCFKIHFLRQFIYSSCLTLPHIAYDCVLCYSSQPLGTW